MCWSLFVSTCRDVSPEGGKYSIVAPTNRVLCNLVVVCTQIVCVQCVYIVCANDAYRSVSFEGGCWDLYHTALRCRKRCSVVG